MSEAMDNTVSGDFRKRKFFYLLMAACVLFSGSLIYWESEHQSAGPFNLILLISLAGLLLGIWSARRLYAQINISLHLKSENEEHREHFITTLSSITDGVISTDLAGQIVFMNNAAEKMTGCNYQESKGKKLKEVYNVRPEHAGNPGLSVAERVLQTGKYVTRENNTVLLTCTKDERMISNAAAPVFDKAGNLTGALIVFSDETGNRKQERRINESDEKYRLLFEQATTAIFITDPKGRFLEINKNAIDLIGYTRTELQGMRYDDLLTPEEIKQQPPRYAELLQGKTIVSDRRLMNKAGSVLYVEIIARLLTDGRIMGIVKDITSLKKLQKELEDYKYALDKATIVTMTDSDGLITHANDYFCDISGYSRQELIGMNNNIVNSGYHPTSYFTKLWQTIKEGKVWNGEIKNRAKDGSVFWVNATVIPFLDETGKPYKYAGICHDITQRKLAEEARMETLQRYELITRATSDTIWDWDIQQDTIVYSEGMKAIYGYSEKELTNTKAWRAKNIHPEDYQRVTESLAQAFALRLEFTQLEYRYLHVDGRYIEVFDRAAIMYDDKDNPFRMIGVMQDITFRREEKRKLDRAIIQAQENERRTIGMELHDNVNQLLSASLLYMSTLDHTGAISAEQNEKVIGICRSHIMDAVREIRTISHQLAPASGGETPIQEAFQDLLNSISAVRSFSIHLCMKGFDDRDLDGEIKLNLYRVLQEQMNNITKYARAREVHVCLSRNDVSVKLKITDDGIGFDPQQVKSGIGLTNIRRRASLYNGNASIISTPGNGCRLVVEIPVNPVTVQKG